MARRNGGLEVRERAHIEPGEAFLQGDFTDVFSKALGASRRHDRARPTNGSDRGFARSNLIR